MIEAVEMIHEGHAIRSGTIHLNLRLKYDQPSLQPTPPVTGAAKLGLVKVADH